MGSELSFSYEALPARVRFGEGAVAAVGEEVARLGAHRVVVFASPRHQRTVDRLIASIGDVPAEVFDDVRQHVPVEHADQAAEFVADRGANTVVAVGGGSAIGLAKAVAWRRGTAVVAVPTTYAGSEMTQVWGETDAAGKTTREDPAVRPAAVVYDPGLTRSLPAEVAASSGLNAVAHCVGAYCGQRRNPVTGLLASEGLRRLRTALPRVVDGEAAGAADALYGACLAGLALSQAGSWFHHRLCHVLGGRYGLPHAQTHAVLLPHTVWHAARLWPERLEAAGSALGGESPAEAVAALAVALRAPNSLAALGLPAQYLGQAVEHAAVAVEADSVRPDQVAALLRAAYGPTAPKP